MKFHFEFKEYSYNFNSIITLMLKMKKNHCIEIQIKI